MNNGYFVKFIEHSPEFYFLLQKRPSALLLLMILVDRARKVELTLTDGMHVGDAKTGKGDAKLYKATVRQYRTDIEILQKLGLISTHQATHQGRIIKIVNSSIFNISREISDSPSDPPPTHDRPTTDPRPTPKQDNKKKEVREEKKINKKSFPTLGSVDEEVMLELAKEYNVSLEQVRELKETMRIWCEIHEVVTKNYKARLENFLRKEKTRNTPKEEKLGLTLQEALEPTRQKALEDYHQGDTQPREEFWSNGFDTLAEFDSAYKKKYESN